LQPDPPVAPTLADLLALGEAEGFDALLSIAADATLAAQIIATVPLGDLLARGDYDGLRQALASSGRALHAHDAVIAALNAAVDGMIFTAAPPD
jgi:hypothetical protein